MADRPILFSAPMVRALLEGRKTQTRRIINFPGVEKVLDFVKVGTDKEGRTVYEMKDARGQFVTRPAGKGFVDYHFSPRIGVGDRMWVRENVSAYDDVEADSLALIYEADERKVSLGNRNSVSEDVGEKWWLLHAYRTDNPDIDGGKRVPAIHMPRWASRLTLIVTDVRVERLQAISERDAEAEGVEWETADPPFCYVPGIWPHDLTAVGVEQSSTPFSACYLKLWDYINGAGSAAANPWVAAYTFRVVKQNIDQIDKVAA